MNEIELGDVAEDKVTRFRGVVVGVYTRLHGCDMLVIQPERLRDGRVAPTEALERGQLRLVKKRSAPERPVPLVKVGDWVRRKPDGVPYQIASLSWCEEACKWFAESDAGYGSGIAENALEVLGPPRYWKNGKPYWPSRESSDTPSADANEFAAMEATLRAWAPLDEPARDRVWSWVNAKLEKPA